MRLRLIALIVTLLLPLGAARADAIVIQPEEILPLKKGADAGDPDAMYRLGIAYLSGMGGLTPDVSRGMDYIEQAGKKGKREAQFFMGAMLQGINARDNFKDKKKTTEQLKWLALSYKQGCAGSAGLIAGYYVTVQGADSPKALQWFLRAAKGGDVGSQALLAKIAMDIGNDVEAYAWTALTVHEHPHLKAAKAQLEMLEKKLEGEALEQAKALAERFIKEYGREGDYPFCTIGALQAISPLKY